MSVAGVSREEDREWTDRYRGAVLSSSQPLSLTSTVTAYADGEVVGSEYQNGETPEGPMDSCTPRKGCTAVLAGWFSDSACTKAWKGAPPQDGDSRLYSYNELTVTSSRRRTAPDQGTLPRKPGRPSAERSTDPSSRRADGQVWT